MYSQKGIQKELHNRFKVYIYLKVYRYMFLSVHKEKRKVKQSRVTVMIDQNFSMFCGEVVGFGHFSAMIFSMPDEPIAFSKVRLARKNLQSSL